MPIFQTTEPVVDVSVNGGPSVPVLVDTGSTGLVIPLKDIGLFNLGLPTGVGTGAYSGGLTYFFVKFDTTVNFGNGIVSTIPVDVVVLSFPTPFGNFAGGNGAAGIMGVGVNAGGPSPGASPVSGLPSTMSEGVLINEPRVTMQFSNTNPLPRVQLDLRSPGQLPEGIGQWRDPGVRSRRVHRLRRRDRDHPVIRRIGADGVDSSRSTTKTAQSCTTTRRPAANSPTSVSDGSMNTGFEPFAQGPVYISYSPEWSRDDVLRLHALM